MGNPGTAPTASAHDRLLLAARNCFLADDYHDVSTRRIAEEARVNVSMIRYYFGSKEGLYEAMIRHTLAPLLDVLDSDMMASPEGFTGYFRIYYRAMQNHPEFPRLMLKVLALKHGPGRRFILELLERGRSRGAKRLGDLKQGGAVQPDIDPDVLRMSFVSMAMTPLLLKEIFEEQLGRPMDAAFFENLARLNGQLLAAGLRPPTTQPTTTQKDSAS